MCNYDFVGRITRVEYKRESSTIIIHGEDWREVVSFQLANHIAVLEYTIALCKAVGGETLGEQPDGTFRVGRIA